MTRRLELFYDFRSPYGHLAYTQLGDFDAEIKPRPITVLKVMEAVGNAPTAIACAAKGRYSRIDLSLWAKRYGVATNPSNVRENDGDACARAVLAATSAADAATITLVRYRAGWSETTSLATKQDNPAVIAAAGVDPGPIAARIDAPDVVAQLAANTVEATQRGVFGSPAIFVGDEMFVSNDRLDFVREHLARQEEEV